MNTEILREYATLKQKIAEFLEAEGIMKVAVMAELEKAGKTKETTDFGTFSKATRKNYSYSPKIETLEEKVKLAKLKEVEKGLAKVKETNYLIYKPK